MSDPVYQVAEWLEHATGLLEASQVPTARLDALIFLEDITQKDRSYLLAHPEMEIEAPHLVILGQQLSRRSEHEPLAYIRGKSEFYGREFLVTPATLQPRPETETMIDLLKSLEPKAGSIVADIGTGSGAIAITTKIEFPNLVVHGTEIQPEALAVAHKNKEKLSADVKFYEGNLLEPLRDTPLDIILANLPYVPDSHTINEAAMQEPAVAIFGGEDGLDLYMEMFKQLKARPQKPAYILTESLPFQHGELAKIAEASGYQLARTEDFVTVFDRPRA